MKLCFFHKKQDCHPILVDFGYGQFSSRLNDKAENLINKPLDWFSSETVQPFESQYRKPTKRNTKTILQQSAILDDTDISNHDDRFEKTIPQIDYLFSLDFSLINNPFTYEMHNDSENENLQLQFILET